MTVSRKYGYLLICQCLLLLSVFRLYGYSCTGVVFRSWFLLPYKNALSSILTIV